MRSLLVVLSACALSSACHQPGGEAVVGDRSLAVTMGSPAPNDPAVVALTIGGGQFCTGTLIAPRHVVTAAHCLPPNVDFIPSMQDIDIYFGSDVDAGGTFVDVSDGLAHPDWSLEELPYDIGVVELASDAPVAPKPFNITAFDGTYPGRPIRVVGFGVTSFGGSDNGLKRQGTAAIDLYDDFGFSLQYLPSGTCNGDSGGPTFMHDGTSELFVGIHSRSDCEGIAYDERFDRHWESFIKPFMELAVDPACAADGLCGVGCTAIDPDCPCEGDMVCNDSCVAPAIDPDCDPVCEDDGVCVAICTDDPDCPICEDDGLCVAECTDDPDCDPVCEDDGVCVAECTDDPDCAPVCEDDGTCVEACTDDPDCDPVCEDDGTCVEACTDDPDCGPVCEDDGTCVEACTDDPDCAPICEDDGTCVEACTDDPDCGAGVDEEDGAGCGCRAGGNGGWAAGLLVLIAGLATRGRRVSR